MGVLVSLLSGCKLAEPPKHSQLLTNALPAGVKIPAEWIAGGTTNAVGDNWLKTFNDPELNALVYEAITNNLNLRQASARVEASRQMVNLVGAKLKPQVGLDFGLATTRSDENDDWYHSTKGLVGAAWEPDVWGKLRAQHASSKAGFRATELDYSFGRQSLAATVAKSWYLNIETRQLLDIAKQMVGIYSNELDLVKFKRDAGKVGNLDVSLANADFHAAQSDLNSAREIYNIARRNLEVLLGRYPAAELAVAKDFAEIPPLVQSSLPLSLLERRPDLIAAEQKVLAAFRSEEAARLALLPDFSIDLAGGQLSDSILSILETNPWVFGAGVGMTVPIYTGGALTAKVKIASARQQEAVAAYGAAVLTAFREVENNLMNEKLYAERLLLDRAVLEDRTESVRIAQLKYNAGSFDLLQLLQLQAAQVESQIEVTKLHNARLANRINLHLSLGGSFDSAPADATIVASADGGIM